MVFAIGLAALDPIYALYPLLLKFCAFLVVGFLNKHGPNIFFTYTFQKFSFVMNFLSSADDSDD
jgi:hypothetical protein